MLTFGYAQRFSVEVLSCADKRIVSENKKNVVRLCYGLFNPLKSRRKQLYAEQRVVFRLNNVRYLNLPVFINVKISSLPVL
ncbi:MAG TPA: hypothetical protein DER68_02160 [Ruminococcaceae bacterium]|nr:hypothetical protein [Oscillospiraceae bacterium]